MFTCRDAAEHMTDEREGALTGVAGVRYRFHMLLCPHCKRCRAQLEEATALAREVPAGEVSEKVVDGAMAAFRARSRG